MVLVFSNVEGMTIASTVPHQQKGPASKTQIPCPDTMELYNQGMLGVDLQRIIWIENQPLDFIRAYFWT